MGGFLKGGALALGLAVTSGAFAQAASVEFNSGACFLDVTTCTLDITGAGVTPGAQIELTVGTGEAFNFHRSAQGLGIGVIIDSDTGNNDFRETFSISVNQNLIWTGGQFASIETTASVSPAIDVSGPGVMTTIFADEDDFNTEADGRLNTVARGYSVAIEFLANQTYQFSFADFANIGTGEEAYVQLRSMDFSAGSAPQVQLVPLPATVWMMLSAIGFLGWRKYRAA